MNSKGFVYVASLSSVFITAARYSASSLKDYWPEANITLFTHPKWVVQSDYLLFDQIITRDVPFHVRAKLWALDKTPYDLTCYIDCDTEVHHEDIKYIFDQHDPNADISLTKTRPYAASIDPKFPDGELVDHCGLFVYNKKESTLRFMREWWNQYKQQTTNWGDYDPKLYPSYLKPWDMFAYWWLQNKTEFKIKRAFFPDPDARWNYIYVYKKEELQGTPVVISHRPVPRNQIK